MVKKKTSNEFELVSTARYRRFSMTKAMRGKIERGLVELITNSDDSYHDLEEIGTKVSGKIRIEVDRKRGTKNPIVIVKDRAEGMSGSEMQEKLGTQGGRTSGFEEGKARRGIYGRGAKDVASFGCVHFESIKDDRYSHFVISSTLTCRFEQKDQKITPEIRGFLGISKGNGTIVMIEVNKNFIIPQHDKLTDLLSRYYSLRDIMSNPKREIVLVDLNSKRTSLLTYKYQPGLVVFEDDIEIPGYPKAKTHLLLKKHATEFDQTSSPLREGIIISSGSAIHDCTHFQLDSDPYAWRFTGELYCPYIDVLVKEYDDEDSLKNPAHSGTNPILLVDPDRDGLVNEHPFARLLMEKCRKILKRYIDELKSSEALPKREVTDEILNNKLKLLSKEISKIFENKLKEIEEDMEYNTESPISIPPGGPGIYIIPPTDAPIVVNTPKTFTIKIVGHDSLDETLPISITSSSKDITARVSEVYLKKFFENQTIGMSTFTLEGDAIGAESIIEVSYNGFSADILVYTVEPPLPPNLQAGLSFDKPLYHLKTNKTKTLYLWLKTGTNSNTFYDVKITSDNPDIIIKDGGKPRLNLTSNPGVFKGEVHILGRVPKTKTTITAEIPDFNRANTEVTVEEKEPGGIALNFVPDEEPFGPVRYKWDPPTSYNLKIGAQHPSIRKYLGQPQGNVYPGLHDSLYMCVLVEVIAEALAFKLLEKYFNAPGQMGMMNYPDMDMKYHKDYSDFLNICHKYVDSNNQTIHYQPRII